MSETNEPPPILPYQSRGAHVRSNDDVVGSVFLFCLSCYLAVAAWLAASALGRELREDQPILVIFGCCSIGIVIIMPAAFALGVSLFLFRTLSCRWRHGRGNWVFALTGFVHCIVVMSVWTARSNAGLIYVGEWPQMIAHLLPLVAIPAVAPLWLLRATPSAGNCM